MRLILAIVACAGVAACSDFPELDAAVSDRARGTAYPTLIPSELIAQERTAPVRVAPGDGETLQRRADLLRARGAAVRGPDAPGTSVLARADRLRARGEILRDLQTIDEETRIRISDRLNALGG